MTVPDATTLEDLIDEGNTLGFMSGTAAVDLAAMTVAWELAEHFVGTYFLSGAASDEILWPDGWSDYDISYKYVQLDLHHVISITGLTLLDDSCTCDLDDDVKIVDARLGIAQLCMCSGSGCTICGTLCGSGCLPWPGRAQIEYIAGLFNTPADLPMAVKMALWLLAQWWAGILGSGGADATTGVIDSWRSMDYNESYGNIITSELGSSPQASAAFVLLRPYRVKRAISIKGYFPTKRSRGP